MACRGSPAAAAQPAARMASAHPKARKKLRVIGRMRRPA
jgi:hypothetical protein